MTKLIFFVAAVLISFCGCASVSAGLESGPLMPINGPTATVSACSP